MKRKLAAIAVFLCVVASLIPPAGRAASDIYFAAIDNVVLPLNAGNMPKYFGSTAYIPSTFFSYDKLGVYYVQGNGLVLLYSGQKKLTFDLARATVIDQDGIQHFTSARESDGLVYVPVNDVCDFFGLTWSRIQAEPAPVIRFMTGATLINDLTFKSLESVRSDMKKYYDDYTGVPVSPGIPASPSSSPGTTPTYGNVYIYPSFYDLPPKNFAAVLDVFDAYKYQCTFFVSADEITAGEAALLRRAAGAGHAIGIWLKEGTYDEYQKASSLLFEAAKIRTILISAGGSAAKTAEASAVSKGLIFWRASETYDASHKFSLTNVTNMLDAFSGSRESVNFACTDSTAAATGALLSYLSENNYIVRRITERTAPTISIG